MPSRRKKWRGTFAPVVVGCERGHLALWMANRFESDPTNLPSSTCAVLKREIGARLSVGRRRYRELTLVYFPVQILEKIALGWWPVRSTSHCCHRQGGRAARCTTT